jgi:hypothetical protein
MSYQNLIFYGVIILFVYNTFNARKLRHKIRCRYTSITKQTQEQVVDASSNIVVFTDKKITKRFYIITSCVKHRWWEEGLQWFSPMFMPEIDYNWNSPYPIDPNTGQPIVLSPETAGIIKKEENARAYAGGQQMEMTKGGGNAKLSGMSKYLPWIAIIAVALVAVYFYNQNASTQAALKVVELNLQKILVKIGGD